MPHEEIDGVPIWYEEHGDPTGPSLVALHGGIITFRRSFGGVLPWLAEGRRVIGVELQGHGHTPDTGRAMSIERFADDVAELIDRVAGGGPVGGAIARWPMSSSGFARQNSMAHAEIDGVPIWHEEHGDPT